MLSFVATIKVQINRKSRERFCLNPNRDAINKRRRNAAKRSASHVSNSALDGYRPSCEVPSPNVHDPDVYQWRREREIPKRPYPGFGWNDKKCGAKPNHLLNN
ncbi:hypothetical protein Leryth_012980, partial [Lithospermum erythrorhizon]